MWWCDRTSVEDKRVSRARGDELTVQKFDERRVVGEVGAMSIGGDR